MTSRIFFASKAVPTKELKSVFNVENRPIPIPKGKDLLIRTKAVATNPIDYKILSSRIESKKIIAGWDCAGVVEAVGNETTLFKVGDEVYCAGSLIRDGCFADHVLVDERIVGSKPKNLSWIDSAVIPLTTLTAWELLERSFHISRKNNATREETVLITAAAGGVGSIAIQLAKKVFGLRVVASASRPESVEWVKRLGADYVINHYEDFKTQLDKFGITEGVEYVAHFTDLDEDYLKKLVEVTKPYGKIGCIVLCNNINIGLLMEKSISFHYEFMFTPSMTGANIQSQHDILTEAAKLFENKVLVSTLNKVYPFSVDGLSDALSYQQSGKAIGKIGLNVV
ncbi:hypothetical protein HDU92_003579 [Lobulomyces angularis]|nr:hypothetical protein HDU92_003579 [Lobulomyces angularis]